MRQLEPEELQAEIASFNMALQAAFQNGEAYITIHRDVAQGMLNLEFDLKGTNMALEERIEELESDPLISYVTRSKTKQ